MAKNKFYVVWQGKTPGIYNSWDECRRQVIGQENARYKGFPTLQEAELAYAGSWEVYYSPALKAREAQLNLSLLPEAERPIRPALCVDAACSGVPGKMEYRGVIVDENGNQHEVFRRGPFEWGTNNIGEFLAIVHGLALLKKQNIDLPIYSDSVTAQAWVRQGKCKTKHAEDNRNHILFDVTRRAEQWLQNNSYSTPILKWQTDKWGEIPADFGRK